MKKQIALLAVLLLAAAVCAEEFKVAPEKGDSEGPGWKTFKGKDLDTLKDGETARVMVYLKDDTSLKPRLSKLKAKDKNELIKLKQKEITKSVRANQEKVLAKLEKDEIKLRNRFSLINAFSAEMDKKTIEKLRRDPDVAEVASVGYFHKSINDTRNVINTTQAWTLKQYGINITGAGQTVCILDSGFNYSHSWLAGCSLAQIRSGSCARVPWCYDYYNDAEGEDTDCMDEDSHGTHVTGIVASDHSVYRGVAPDVKFVHLKVLDSNGDGSFDALAKAIEACTLNKSAWGVSVITMSLGSGAYSCSAASCVFTPAGDGGTSVALENAFDAGIFSVAAAGNDYDTTKIDFPACNPYAFSVGSVTKTDSVSSFSNSCSIMNVWAPGSDIWSTYIWGAPWIYRLSGTSQATPHVAGAAALIQQYANLLNGSNLPPDRVGDALENTGVPVSRGALTRNRVDIMAALRYFNFQAPRLGCAPDAYFGNASYLFNFTATYLDRDNSAPSYMYVVIDGVQYSMQDNGSNDYYSGVLYYYNTTLSSGEHTFYFNASDGGYTNVTPVSAQNVTVNTNFTFAGGAVSPTSGGESTVYNYTIVYADPDDMAPEYIYAVVDGTQYSMLPNSSDYDGGVLYHYDTSSLSGGAHTYYFNASDNYYAHYTGSTANPTVNNAPSLSSPSVTPTYGEENSHLFNYTVTYADADDDAPTQAQVSIDGSAYDMQNIGTTYSAGVKYYYNRTLTAGTHGYRFLFSDGTDSTSTSTVRNPKVYAAAPDCDGASVSAAVWTVDEYTNCTDTALVPTDPKTGYLDVTGGNILNLTNTQVYLNNTLARLNGKLILSQSEFFFIS